MTCTTRSPRNLSGAGRLGGCLNRADVPGGRLRRARVRGAACVVAACLVAACGGGNPCDSPPPPSTVPADHVLLDPDSPALRELPPDSFDVRFATTRGDVVVRIHRDWAPMGAFRFYNLARNGFYDGARFYRVLPGFVAQFGMSGHPEIDQLWLERPIPDDPRRVGNSTGTLTYAKTGTDSRTTQLFFNYRANVSLDEQNFAPIGRVIEGMSALYLLYGEYGELQPDGDGPSFGCIASHGNVYLSRYRNLDAIESLAIDREYR